MEPHYYLALLRRRAALILLAAFAAGAVGFVATSRTPRYAAHASVYVGPLRFSVDPQRRIVDPTEIVGQLMTTYGTMLASEPVADDALKRTNIQLSAPYVVSHTSVTIQSVGGGDVPKEDTQLVTLTVTARTAHEARDLANAMADAFVAKVETFDTPATAEGNIPSLPAYVFERAKLPAPDPSNRRQNVLIGFALALVTVGGLVLAWDRFDGRVKSAADAEHRLGVPVLGMVPYAAAADVDMALANQPQSTPTSDAMAAAAGDGAPPRL